MRTYLKTRQENSRFIQIGQEWRVLYMTTNIHFSHISPCSSWDEKYFRQNCRQNHSTHFVVNDFFFENSTVYEMQCKNILQPDRPQVTIWCMRIACWITKATNTHSEYIILIVFLLQQWLPERSSMLSYVYTYSNCLVMQY